MSKEQIIKDLPDEFVRQMRNWVLTGSCVGLYAISPAYEGMPHNMVYRSRPPPFGGEYSHLERALDALPSNLWLAVRLFWQYEGNDLVWLGKRLKCDFRTVEKRVREGHDLMRNDIARRQAAHDKHLERQSTALLSRKT